MIGWPEKALNKDVIETTPTDIRLKGVLGQGKSKSKGIELREGFMCSGNSNLA